MGSGFCPFLCVRRLAECDASLASPRLASPRRQSDEHNVTLSLGKLHLCCPFPLPTKPLWFCGVPCDEEPSLSPAGGYFKKFLIPKRLVKNSAEHWLNFGHSPAVGYYPTFLGNSYKPPTTPRHWGHERGITAEPEKKNATMQGCCGDGLQCCNLHYGRDQNQYLPFFLVTMLGIAFFASFTVRREIPFPSAAWNTFSAMIS